MSSPDFEPEMKLITAITNAVNAAVTTSTNHGYNSDETICLVVPLVYGMHLNYVETKITVTGLAAFTCNLDTSAMDPFVVPGATPFTPAHCCPVTQIMDNVAIF